MKISLIIIGEGQTESNFAVHVLKPHLAAFNVFVDAHAVITSRDRRSLKEYRGGLSSYDKAKRTILNSLNDQPRDHYRFTSMFDLYNLPENFPGYDEAGKVANPYERVRILEESLAEDIKDRRFIPYIQLYEFETLILADPINLHVEYLEHATAIDKLIAMVGDKNPEEINDGSETAPSKRICKLIPKYHKPTAAVSVLKKTGVPTLRAKCRHFNDWLTCLEQLAGVSHE